VIIKAIDGLLSEFRGLPFGRPFRWFGRRTSYPTGGDGGRAAPPSQ
jgi:hypothetical protein